MERTNAYGIPMGKNEGKITLKRARRRCVDNIKMNQREICGVGWTDITRGMDQWRTLVNKIMHIEIPYNAEKFVSSCTAGGFSRRVQLHGVRDYATTNLNIDAHKTPSKFSVDVQVMMACRIFKGL
jgi:hypothetical protein